MSDFRAIAGVSATLQALLQDRMEFPLGTSTAPVVTVSTPRADTDSAAGQPETARVNLFLYRVAESPQLRNQEIPGRGHPAAYGTPPLSLTLHYLLTAYGGAPIQVPDSTEELFDETQSHLVLGSAMRALHDVPVVTDRLTTARAPIGRPILHESLRSDVERVKLTLEPLSLEDVTKVWTALAQRFRLSAAYAVSVVQIESRRPRAFPRPVGEPPAAGPRVQVFPLRPMRIDEVRVRRSGETRERPNAYARVGDTLVLLGQGFAGADVRAALGALESAPALADERRMEVVVPDAELADGTAIAESDRLQPGAHAVAAVTPLLGTARLRSNHAAFMLVPNATSAGVASATPRQLDIVGTRLWHEGLTGEAIVGRAVVPRARYVTAGPAAIAVPLPDSLPARDVPALVSGELTVPVTFTGAAEIKVSVGGVMRMVSLPSELPSAAAAAAAIQLALREKAGGAAAFRGFRAAAVADRLVLVAGGLSEPVTVEDTATAGALALGAADSRQASGWLSGALRPFPALSASEPKLLLELGGTTRTVTLAARPLTLDDAADLLQAAVNDADPAAAFADALVAVLGDQLLLVPGDVGTVDVQPDTTDDPLSAAELELRATYPVRVRVNGAESVNDLTVELPT